MNLFLEISQKTQPQNFMYATLSVVCVVDACLYKKGCTLDQLDAIIAKQDVVEPLHLFLHLLDKSRLHCVSEVVTIWELNYDLAMMTHLQIISSHLKIGTDLQGGSLKTSKLPAWKMFGRSWWFVWFSRLHAIVRLRRGYLLFYTENGCFEILKHSKQ